MLVKPVIKVIIPLIATTLLAPIFASNANALQPKPKSTISAEKAATNLANGLNRIVKDNSTSADLTAVAVGLTNQLPDIAVTTVPFYGNLVFFDVVAPDGFRCVASKLNKARIVYEVINSDCKNYSNIIGPNFDKSLLMVLKTKLMVGFVAYNPVPALINKRKVTPELIQKYGTTLKDKLKIQAHVVQNTPNGISVTLVDRVSVVAKLEVDSKGNYKVS